jgi:hypothetical protein
VNSRLIVVAVMAATFVGFGSASARDVRRTGLTPISRFATELIDVARARSATVRDLEHTIQSSNIVVYVNSDWRPAGGPAASVRWLTEAAGTRYVLLFVDIQMAPHRRIELLGHELSHVVELAGAPWVHNESDMRRLYEEIGRQTSKAGEARTFETAGARATEQDVHHDLWDVTTPANEAVMALARR